MKEAEKHTVFAARLTQRGHEIHSMDDLLLLYEKAFTDNTLANISALPPSSEKSIIPEKAEAKTKIVIISFLDKMHSLKKSALAALHASNESASH